jgi:hypothetical protein
MRVRAHANASTPRRNSLNPQPTPPHPTHPTHPPPKPPGATFLLINVRSYAVGYLEEQRDPARAVKAAVTAGIRD